MLIGNSRDCVLERTCEINSNKTQDWNDITLPFTPPNITLPERKSHRGLIRTYKEEPNPELKACTNANGYQEN
ncbi:hypothetical protein PNOK_0693200 [Pyrrhoderma noxium]|uniref:Uncharacterized protein n=1 Tax=Pyrrhoderma noxium TaxID=2282107 RepID=A0A286UBC6_9AGAM|nr:hypothetical protein PNOK_0693200 [Pyrrhoderma noxium]